MRWLSTGASQKERWYNFRQSSCHSAKNNSPIYAVQLCSEVYWNMLPFYTALICTDNCTFCTINPSEVHNNSSSSSVIRKQYTVTDTLSKKAITHTSNRAQQFLMHRCFYTFVCVCIHIQIRKFFFRKKHKKFNSIPIRMCGVVIL